MARIIIISRIYVDYFIFRQSGEPDTRNWWKHKKKYEQPQRTGSERKKAAAAAD